MSEDRLREAKELLNQVHLIILEHTSDTDGSRDGNLEEALRLFEQVLQLSPNNLEALEGAAYCNRKSNKLDQAVQLYQQCLKVNASAESPLYYLGDILYRQHRHAECQAYLSRLVASNCGEDYKTGALYLLAKSHISLDEHEEAEKQARSGLTLKPNHPHFLFILALVKNRMGDFDASITTLKKAFQHLGVDSDNLKVEIHDWLAQAYERKGEYTNASAELAMALKQDPSHVSSLITQGVIHMQLKKLEEAETSFRRALAIVKNHALALVRLGYCKLLCADSQEAILLFQRALQQRCGTVALPRCGHRVPERSKWGLVIEVQHLEKNTVSQFAKDRSQLQSQVATPTPSTATPSSERRQWTSPSPATPAAAPPAVPKAEAADKGKLLLHKHEMIDFNQLVQRDCLGSGGFGAVYRGYLGSREVAIKKLFCEDGGNISPLQLEELEKEVAALRSALLETQRTVNVVEQGVGLNTPGNAW
ncbi:unnamed protein product [Durusdinium trenchii]|uniref:Protein kinase domain-containing protein n=1 Tax=Durusdinium trenchii TaxID=1381693 RepID=A0ABP0T029_9DINO